MRGKSSNHFTTLKANYRCIYQQPAASSELVWTAFCVFPEESIMYVFISRPLGLLLHLNPMCQFGCIYQAFRLFGHPFVYFLKGHLWMYLSAGL